ncbi:unnamed protein product [Amoebophrya sp. A120]|nr:unnamed protein product [Amoebophrya sp. A120]|eukprot:GSA120T00015176001.1
MTMASHTTRTMKASPCNSLPQPGDLGLLVRSQGNTVDLMRLEVQILTTAASVVERSCGFHTVSRTTAAAHHPLATRLTVCPEPGLAYPSRHTGKLSTRKDEVVVDALGGCLKRYIKVLLSAAGPAELVQQLVRDEQAVSASQLQDQDKNVAAFDCFDGLSCNFTLDYEQTQRCSELEQIPFVPGVGQACRLTQTVSRLLELRKTRNIKQRQQACSSAPATMKATAAGSCQAASSMWTRHFVIIDYKEFVCLAEDLTTSIDVRAGLQTALPLDIGSVTFEDDSLPVSTTIRFWDRFFHRWSRSGKPWSFSASIDPFVAQACLNLLLFVDWCLRFSEKKNVPAQFRQCLASDDLDNPLVARVRNMCIKRGEKARQVETSPSQHHQQRNAQGKSAAHAQTNVKVAAAEHQLVTGIATEGIGSSTSSATSPTATSTADSNQGYENNLTDRASSGTSKRRKTSLVSSGEKQGSDCLLQQADGQDRDTDLQEDDLQHEAHNEQRDKREQDVEDADAVAAMNAIREGFRRYVESLDKYSTSASMNRPFLVSEERAPGDSETSNGTIQKDPRPRLLDACCGSGTITAVASASGRFSQIISCDKSPEFLDRAAKNLDFVAADSSLQRSAQCGAGATATGTTSAGAQSVLLAMRTKVHFVENDWIADAEHDAESGDKETERQTRQNADASSMNNATQRDQLRGVASTGTLGRKLRQKNDVFLPSKRLGTASGDAENGFTTQSTPLVVMANTPWGRRFGGEGDACGVLEGVIRQCESNADLFGFLVPPRSLESAKKLLDIHLCVPLGKPALFLIGTVNKKRKTTMSQ